LPRCFFFQKAAGRFLEEKGTALSTRFGRAAQANRMLPPCSVFFLTHMSSEKTMINESGLQHKTLRNPAAIKNSAAIAALFFCLGP